jgi:hypothetical protein
MRVAAGAKEACIAGVGGWRRRERPAPNRAWRKRRQTERRRRRLCAPLHPVRQVPVLHTLSMQLLKLRTAAPPSDPAVLGLARCLPCSTRPSPAATSPLSPVAPPLILVARYDVHLLRASCPFVDASAMGPDSCCAASARCWLNSLVEGRRSFQYVSTKRREETQGSMFGSRKGIAAGPPAATWADSAWQLGLFGGQRRALTSHLMR